MVAYGNRGNGYLQDHVYGSNLIGSCHGSNGATAVHGRRQDGQRQATIRIADDDGRRVSCAYLI